MIIISIITGTLITVVLSGLFQYKAPFFIPVVLGIVVTCNIEKKRIMQACISVALLSDIILIYLSLSINTSEYWKHEIIRYVSNIVIAVVLGYGYSRRKQADVITIQNSESGDFDPE